MMDVRKILIIFVAVAFMCAPAFAGDQPEFDAVGDDHSNFFKDDIKQMVINNNIAANGNRINCFSDFTEVYDCGLDVDDDYTAWEFFEQTAGALYVDPCFDRIAPYDYKSALTDWWNSGTYEWQIVLQKKPQTDIKINIVDCVLKHNSFDPFGDTPYSGAEQTGRYTMPWGEPVFVPSANPKVTVSAYPGCYATAGFTDPFFLDARTITGLIPVPLVDALYTSIGVWDDGIVMRMPETGNRNLSGQSTFRLKQGDRILVRVDIPANNSVDIRYGQDNVMLEYVAVHGTEFLFEDYDNICFCEEPEE